MEPKKISFGFSKINKKPNLITNKETNKTEAKVELIKCLEGQEIKLIEEKPEEKPLVIPLKENQKTSTALASLMRRRAVLLGEEEPNNTTDDQIEDKNNSNNVDVAEDLEKRAARELLAELQTNGSTDAASTLVLPVVKPDDLPLEGAKESSLDDYENIPIQDFGKAMLRGMGWKEPPKTNKKRDPPLDETPMVRPKGMGLGADKALNKKPLLVAPEANEVLEIKRNAYVRILGGKHKDLYGQIEGFDDHAGRVIVKMAIGGNKEAFNEFLCQPVSRKEYTQYGKCINSSKYEEYKKKENEHGQIILNQDERDKIERSYSIKDEKNVKKERQASSEMEDKYNKRSDNRHDNKYMQKKSDRERDYDYNREKETVQKGDKEKYQNSTNRDDKKYIKKESDRDQDYDYNRERKTLLRRDNEKYDDKYQNRDKNRRERESSRDREYKKSYKNDNRNDDYKESNRYESRTDYYRDRERDTQRDYNRSSNKDRQQERDRESYNERNARLASKTIDLVDSSCESQSDSHLSKHKKSKKTKSSKKKSKKSKKNKSKYKSESSDSETSSSDTESSSSNSEEERHRKFKKKTKKSKKQRERSRSRGR